MDCPRASIVARLTVNDLPSRANAPAGAAVPGIPADADASSVPHLTAAAAESAVPAGPALPAEPARPAEPAVPAGPAASAESARLAASAVPAESAVPAGSVAPATPAESAGSAGTAGSVAPAAPAGALRVPALLALPTGRLLLVHDHRPAPRATDWTAGGALPDDLPNPNTLWLRTSDDAGSSWTRPRRLVPGLAQAGCEDGEIPPFLRVTGVSDPSLLAGPDGSVHLFAAASTDVGLFGAHPPTRPVHPDRLPEPGTLRLLHAVSRDEGETWAWEDLTDLFLAPDHAGTQGGGPEDACDDLVGAALSPAAAGAAPTHAATDARQDSVPAPASAPAPVPVSASENVASPAVTPSAGVGLLSEADAWRADRTEASGGVGFPVSGHGTSVGERLVQPVVVALPARPDGSRPVRAQALVSDDAGASWHLAAPIPAPAQQTAASLAGGAATSGVDEWAVVGVPGTGELVVSARDGGYGGSRLVSRSEDGGRSWSVPVPEPSLPDPGCNGGLVAVPGEAVPALGEPAGAEPGGVSVGDRAGAVPGAASAGHRAGLLTVPAARSRDEEPGASAGRGGSWVLVCSHAADPAARRHGRLTASWDGGRSWQALADLTGPEDPFAYSDLAWLPEWETGSLVVVAEVPPGDLVCLRLPW